MKKVLITGISGFLGWHCAQKFLEQGYDVSGVDVIVPKNQNEINFRQSEVTFENLKIFDKIFDYIIHCAGGSTVGASIKSPYEEYEKTVSTTMAILEYIRLYSHKTKLIYPSSAAVYGNSYDRAIKEDDVILPYSPYGSYKYIVEELCRSYYKNFNVNSNIIRFFSIYGEGLQKQILFDACKKFKVSDNPEFFGTGEETRDWLYITDAVELIYQIAINTDGFCILNGGSGQGTKIKDVIQILAKNLNKQNIWYFNNKVKEGDPKCYIADISTAKKIGWSPNVDLETGIAKYVKWFKN